MIPEIVSFVTRREGRKFRYLQAIDESLVQAENLKTEAGLSLYVHIPFCFSLCPFCCFNRYLFQEDLARRYFIDLKKAEKDFKANAKVAKILDETDDSLLDIA